VSQGRVQKKSRFVLFRASKYSKNAPGLHLSIQEILWMDLILFPSVIQVGSREGRGKVQNTKGPRRIFYSPCDGVQKCQEDIKIENGGNHDD
jgi:hypothetical protein